MIVAYEAKAQNLHMKAPWGRPAKGEKLVTEGQMSCDSAYLRFPEKWSFRDRQ